jgi:hypothetical protein
MTEQTRHPLSARFEQFARDCSPATVRRSARRFTSGYRYLSLATSRYSTSRPTLAADVPATRVERRHTSGQNLDSVWKSAYFKQKNERSPVARDMLKRPSRGVYRCSRRTIN